MSSRHHFQGELDPHFVDFLLHQLVFLSTLQHRYQELEEVLVVHMPLHHKLVVVHLDLVIYHRDYCFSELSEGHEFIFGSFAFQDDYIFFDDLFVDTHVRALARFPKVSVLVSVHSTKTLVVVFVLRAPESFLIQGVEV